jgi:hypothetical protein
MTTAKGEQDTGMPPGTEPLPNEVTDTFIRGAMKITVGQ